jgi:hypothetical protein
MRSAIDRLTKGNAGEEHGFRIQGPESKSFFLTPGNPEFRADPVIETCSVALMEMHVDNPERFTMRMAPSPVSEDRMPRARMPAPPCEQKMSSTQPR